MSSDQRIAFANNLKNIMKIRHVEQSDIVSALNISASTVSDWVNGKKYPRVEAQQKLADYLGVSIVSLVSSFDFDRVDALCKQKGINKVELAEAIGVAPGTIKMLFQREAIPSISILEKIAVALGVSPGYLMGWDDAEPASPLPSNVRSIQSLHRQVIPMIGEVAAGEPIYAPEELGVYVDSPVDADAAMTVKGDSMAPGYQDGDIVYIKCCPDVPEGMIAVVFLDDEAVIKRVYKRQTGLTLASDNPAYPPIMAEFEDYTNMRIFGEPVGFVRIHKPSIDGKIKKGF